MRFIDEVKIEVRAGSGGAGGSSMRREKYIPKGGPDGGDGGRGGHVILVASKDKNTLQELYLRKRIFAENGKSADSQSKAEQMKAQTEQMQADKAAEKNKEMKRRNKKYNPNEESVTPAPSVDDPYPG